MKDTITRRDFVDGVACAIAAGAAAARKVLYTRPFSDFETALRDQLTRCFGVAGFNAERDIAAITEEIAKVARQPVGGISVAGSDAAWTAYAHAAIDEAQRAAGEVVAGLKRAAA